MVALCNCVGFATLIFYVFWGNRDEIPITGVNMSEKLLQFVLYWFEHNEVPKCL